ncbi:MAG: RidA family protein [Candidatus Dadabacteria bacterium]|nr:MAG: RidA family protein [Candidatus Dadabacteria bacterium]
MKKINVSSGTPWEPLVGFSRSVRVGDMVYVCGTTPSNAQGEVYGLGDAYQQTRKVLLNIKKALEEAGAKLKDVVRTRIYVTDIGELEGIARAHREVFQKIRPATTIVQVQKLIDVRMMVNIEVEAVVGVDEIEEKKIENY